MDGLIARLEVIAAAPRLTRYRAAAADDPDAVILYCWNIQLGEALLPTLGILEVTLRNAVHDALKQQTGQDFWFKDVLQVPMYRNIVDVIGGIIGRQGHIPTVDKVISEITFGFWPKLFGQNYNKRWWDPTDPLLAKVLRGHAKVARDTRTHFERRLEYAVNLRNRIVHQEAIFQGVGALNRPRMPIDELHDQLLETIGWISSDAEKLARCLDRFDQVYHGQEALRDVLRRTFKEDLGS